jgi:hypothetical protein
VEGASSTSSKAGTREQLCCIPSALLSSPYHKHCSPSPQVRTHPVLLGECLGGALYTEDFVRLCREVGFLDPRAQASAGPAQIQVRQHWRWRWRWRRLLLLPGTACCRVCLLGCPLSC